MDKKKIDLLSIVKLCVSAVIIFFFIKIIMILNDFLKDPVGKGFGLATKIAQELADDLNACKKGLLNGECLVGLAFLYYIFGGGLSALLTSIFNKSQWGKTQTADSIELHTGESAVKVLQEETAANKDLQDQFDKDPKLFEEWKSNFAEKLSGQKSGKDYNDALGKINSMTNKEILDIIKSDASRRRIYNKITQNTKSTDARTIARNTTNPFLDWTSKVFGKNGIDPEKGREATGEIEMPEIPKIPK
jgi:hypothetical protein